MMAVGTLYPRRGLWLAPVGGRRDGLSEAARGHACLLNRSLQTVNKNVPYFNLKSLYIADGVWPRRFGREVWILLWRVPDEIRGKYKTIF